MQTQLDNLLPLARYREARAQVFPSDTSLDWFLRNHKEELVDAGALLMIAGRWMAQPAQFDQYILEIGRRAALNRTGSKHSHA